MTQKLLIGGLVLAILAVLGYGLIDAAGSADTAGLADAQPQSPATDVPPPTIEIIDNEPGAGIEDVNASSPDAMGAMGDPWLATGTIASIDDVGFTLTTAEGQFFVELGPPSYWQAQDVVLSVGDVVTVDGAYNGEQVHAFVVTAGGAELRIRNEAGQPLWSGGVENGNGGDGAAQYQLSPEDWVTLTGTVGAVLNSGVTVNVDDDSVVALQMGRPQFWQDQGVTLAVGDPVEVLGFWSAGQFLAGEIRKTNTGETIYLRDPNGRQLWGGPGQSGNGGDGQGGQGNGGDGQGGQGNGGNGQGGPGNGQGAGNP